MKKKLTGIIVSNKMEKTVVVKVEKRFRHPLYKKVITSHKKYKAHNEKLKLSLNDKVVIEETRPISKGKRFVVIKKLK